MEALGFRVAVMGIMVQLSFSNAQTLAVMLNGDFDLPRWLDSAFPQAYQRVNAEQTVIFLFPSSKAGIFL